MVPQRSELFFRACLGLVLVACAGSVAHADKLVFDPSISLGPAHTNNIAFQGSGEERESDTLAVLQLDIPLLRETRRSSLDFRYRPSVLRHQDFDELDYTDHRFDLNWRAETGRRGGLRLRTGYVNTQQQGSPELPTDPDLVLTPRTDREIYRLFVGYTHELSQLWEGEIELRGQAYRYDPIEVAGLTAEFSSQDRTDTGARIGASRRVSSTSSLGGRYEYRYFDLEEGSGGVDPDPGGSEHSNQLAATYRRQIARRLELEAALGGFANSGLREGTDRTGVLAELFLTRTYQSFLVRLDLFHRPSAGGSVDGTAVESTVGVTLQADRDPRRRWFWQVAPRLSRRDSSQDQPTIDTVGLRGELERRFGDLFGLRARVNWFDQSVDEPGRDDDTVLRADLGFVWYPWGNSAIGGRGR